MEIPAAAAAAAAVAILGLGQVMGRRHRSCARRAAAAVAAAAGVGRSIAAARRGGGVVARGASRFQAIAIGAARRWGRRCGAGRAAGRRFGSAAAAGRGARLGLALCLRLGFGLGAGLLLAARLRLGLLLVRGAISIARIAVLRQKAAHKGLLLGRGRYRALTRARVPRCAGRLGLGIAAAAAGRCIGCSCCGCRRAGGAFCGGAAVAAAGALRLLHSGHLGGHGRFGLLGRSGSCIRVCGAVSLLVVVVWVASEQTKRNASREKDIDMHMNGWTCASDNDAWAVAGTGAKTWSEGLGLGLAVGLALG